MTKPTKLEPMTFDQFFDLYIKETLPENLLPKSFVKALRKTYLETWNVAQIQAANEMCNVFVNNKVDLNDKLLKAIKKHSLKLHRNYLKK